MKMGYPSQRIALFVSLFRCKANLPQSLTQRLPIIYIGEPAIPITVIAVGSLVLTGAVAITARPIGPTGQITFFRE